MDNSPMNILRTLIVVFLISSSLHAATWQPYPDAKITIEQWQKYLDTVVSEFGDTRDEVAEAKLILFTDEVTATFYAFTADDHPAHPAWITRKLVEQEGAISIQQIGFFAGEEQAFADLFDDYIALSDKMQQEMATQEELNE